MSLSATAPGTPSPDAASRYLSADAILAADDAVYTIVECPEWGGAVRLRAFTGDERAQFEARLAKRGGAAGSGSAPAGDGEDARSAAGYVGIREHALWLTAVNAAGERIFTDLKQVRGLRAKNAAPLDRCFSAVLKLSGMTKDEQERIAQQLREDPFGDGSSA